MSITIITATINAGNYIGGLIESLDKQSSKNFEWIVMDGGSIDNTVDLVKCSSVPYRLIVGTDFGIYDAINKAIKLAKTKYYLIVGADDRLYVNAVEKFLNALEVNGGFDLYAAHWVEINKIQKPKNGKSYKHGMRSISSCHSVALLINKEMHDFIGYYSKEFPVCADYNFICKALFDYNYKQKVLNFIAGEYATEGYSAKRYLSYIFEIYQIKIRYYNNFIQKIILIYRLFK